jgi:GH24 family phage-related lysozyme (muramidase)
MARSDFITDDFINYLIDVEGTRKKRGKHYAYKSPEGGAKTIGYGHKIKKGENFRGGLTETQAKLLLESDLMDSASAVEKKIGKDWDTLDPKRKQMLVDYQFNLKGGISKFPEFTKAVIANDLDKMREEYKRHYRPDMDTGKKNRTKGGVLEIRPDKQTTKYKELTRRNEKFFNKYLQGGKAMPEDQEVIDGGEDVMTLAGNDSEWMTIPDHQKRARDREKDIQDELQKQMHPDAPKDDAFANVDTEEYFANSEKSKKALEMDYRRFIAKGMKLIHGKDTRENILKSLQIDNPIEAVSNIVTAVINRVDTAIRNSGQKTPDEVKAVAALVKHLVQFNLTMTRRNLLTLWQFRSILIRKLKLVVLIQSN